MSTLFVGEYMKTLEDIYNVARGAAQMAADLGVHQFTVERWRRTGIPLKYWELLIKLYALTPAQLFLIDKKCREKNNKILNGIDKTQHKRA
jgi:hypothetical protein